MPAQTINIISLKSLFKGIETDQTKGTIDMLLEKRFKLGDGYCENMQAHYNKLYRIVKKNYCPVNDFLYKVLKDGVQDNSCVNIDVQGLTKEQNVKPVDTLYQLWLNKGNIGTFNEFIDMLFNNDVDVWEEAAW